MPASPSPDGTPPHILVAERNPTVGLAIASWLRQWGMDVELVRTTEAARAALGAGRFRLLILDSFLGGLDEEATPRLVLHPPGEPDARHPGLARPIGRETLRAALDACLPGPPPAASGLDLAAIAELWGDADSPAFRRIAAAFLAEAPGRVGAIVAAHAVGDRRRLVHEAHALAGAALNVGMPDIVRLARAIEHGTPGQPLDDPAPLVLALQEAAARDFDALGELAGLA